MRKCILLLGLLLGLLFISCQKRSGGFLTCDATKDPSCNEKIELNDAESRVKRGGGTQPEETQPEETQPEETQPEETQPEETQPEETQPEETEADGGEPAPQPAGQPAASKDSDDLSVSLKLQKNDKNGVLPLVKITPKNGVTKVSVAIGEAGGKSHIFSSNVFTNKKELFTSGEGIPVLVKFTFDEKNYCATFLLSSEFSEYNQDHRIDQVPRCQ